jgi:ectoine hydroxylase
VLGPAGCAVLLDRRTWHSRSANVSTMTRKVIWYGYSYRWLRPKDAMTVEHLYANLDPIQRQILGDGTSANGTYDPTDADVPLRGWLHQHYPEAAGPSPHGRSQSRPPAMVRGKNTGRN